MTNIETSITWNDSMMKFNNKDNKPYRVGDKLLFDKRSVAIAGVVMLIVDDKTYVLASRRGPASADSQGLMNLVAGYMDWNEWGYETFIRETWEECGLNLLKLMQEGTVLKEHIKQPWYVQTNPKASQENVTLRYGVIIEHNEFPPLTTIHNDIEGEAEDPMWMPIEDVDDYLWAFNHDNIIRAYELT